jgi:[protein-PII] uridylyltransferase
MIFTIEPMINAGRRDIKEMGDGWTIVTKDRSLSAQWEHTVLVTETGYEVLTLSAGSPPIRRLCGGCGCMKPGAAAATPPPPTVSPVTLAELRQHLRESRKAELEHFRAAAPTVEAAQKLIRAHHPPSPMKRCTGCGALQSMPKTCERWWPSAATVAASCFRYSDVDVLVLLPEGRERLGRRPSRAPWVTSSPPAGTSDWRSARRVRSVAELRGRWPARTLRCRPRLMEARFLTVCGRRALFERLAGRLRARPSWIRRFPARQVAGDGASATSSTKNTPYSLEPNCKESPGGLRDLQVVRWVALAAGLGKSWRDMAAKGLITAFEVRQLQRNEGLLRLIRTRLHVVAGRREDRLIFDLQTAVAESFGHQSTPERRASEALMRRYYWAAKAVVQLNQILMLNIGERIRGSQDAPMRPINERFFDRAGMLEVASDDLYHRGSACHPGHLPDLPAHARHPGPVGAHAARALQRPRC